jgi:hypothetical protein
MLHTMRALAACAAMSTLLAVLPASAQQEILSTLNRRPPYLDPAFPRAPAPAQEKNYALALGEVIGIDAFIWAIDYASGKPYAKISADSISQNFSKGWIVDTDDFWANSLMHPLHGNLTFNASRSLGLNFYESFAGAFIGSLVWEQFAEIQPPSMNDQPGRHGRRARSSRLNHCRANPRPISATVSPAVREADPAEPRRRFRSSEAESCSWFQGSLRLSPPRTVDQLSERSAVGWRSTHGSGRFRL